MGLQDLATRCWQFLGVCRNIRIGLTDPTFAPIQATDKLQANAGALVREWQAERGTVPRRLRKEGDAVASDAEQFSKTLAVEREEEGGVDFAVRVPPHEAVVEHFAQRLRRFMD